MGRLTERFSNGQVAVYGCGNNCKYDFKYCNNHLEDCPTINEIYEKLAEYEDLEEQGKLLKLPVCVGDMVYVANKLCTGEKCVTEEIVDIGLMTAFMLNGEFGKTVFLTKSEAKEALQKMNETEGEND